MVAVDDRAAGSVGVVDTEDEQDTAITPVARPPRVWRDPFVVAAVALVLLPTVAAAISALRNPWAPINDWALIELEVRDVGLATRRWSGRGPASAGGTPARCPSTCWHCRTGWSPTTAACCSRQLS